MLAGLIAGEDDVASLAEHARCRMRPKIPQLRRALQGRLQPEHRFLLRRMLAHVDFLDAAILQVQAEIDTHLAPYAEALALLQTIPGIKATSAATIIAEIGVDMSRFPSAHHLASWAGVCPGNKQSGGKRLQAGTNPGNRWLRGMLGEIVWSISRTHNNYLAAQFVRLMHRRGKYKAVIAVAHSVVIIIYHTLARKQPYTDLGADYFERLDRQRMERQWVHTLEQLGYAVTLTPAVA